MREQDKMTMEQAEAKMSGLREVFPFVRLVKGSVLKDREREPAEGLPGSVSATNSGRKTSPVKIVYPEMCWTARARKVR